MGVTGLLHSHAGFQAAAAFATPPVRPASAPTFWMRPATPTPIKARATSTTALTRRCRRHRDRQPCSSLFSSKDSKEPTGQEDDDLRQPPPPPLGSGQNEKAESETDADTAPREGQILPPYSSDVTDAPEPTRDEQTPAMAAPAAAAAAVDSNADGNGEQATPSQVSNGDGPAEVGGEPEVDWDQAWASTRQKMEKDAKQVEKDRKAAPAFSGRKQVVATKNSDGDYEFEEISSDGSRRQGGKGGSGGFGFADGNQAGADGRGRIQDQEQEAVNLATTNKAFAGLFAVLLASFVFEIYIYLSGGISNGQTRFLERGQPTTYDSLPIPATPTPDDDLSV